jgi:hypothetical protein
VLEPLIAVALAVVGAFLQGWEIWACARSAAAGTSRSFTHRRWSDLDALPRVVACVACEDCEFALQVEREDGLDVS